MIFADPPYHLSNNGFSVASGRRVSVNKFTTDKSQGFEADANFHRRWIQACRKILKPDGSLWVSGTHHSIYQCGYEIQRQGWEILNDISWFKPNASPNIGCRQFTASHETLIWAKKTKTGRHCFNYRQIKACPGLKGETWKQPARQMRSVWRIPTTPAREKQSGSHPTQKPVELLKRIITASSREGDLILDPFSGSGTTGVVALNLNRRFIGLEKETGYLKIAKNRLQAVLESESDQPPDKSGR